MSNYTVKLFMGKRIPIILLLRGQAVRALDVAIRRHLVLVPSWPLAGFVLGSPEFKYSGMLLKTQDRLFSLASRAPRACSQASSRQE